jgi:hypothetical protein
MDKRGRHLNRTFKIDENIWVNFNSFIATFEKHKSHYCYESNDYEYFEDTSLNIKKLYKLFIQYLDKNHSDSYKLGFTTFYMHYIKNCNIKFRNPRKDICDFCFKVAQIGINNLESGYKNHYLSHLDKIKQYRSFKKHIIESFSKSYDTLIIEFDYCQSKPLPKLPNNIFYYSSSLQFNVFNAHIHNNNNVFYVLFH